MKNTTVLFSAVALLSATALFAAPQAGKAPLKTAKVTDVWTCPMTGEKIADHKTEAGKPQVVGNYKVHFCCAGCDTSFAKLSDKDKKTKAAEAAKKDIAKADTTDKKGKS